MAETPREPSTRDYLRAFERIETLKNKLIKMGLLDGGATHEEVIACVKRIVPKELITH